MVNQLHGFIVVYENGGVRVSYTYDEISEEDGSLVSQNNKKSFYAVDETLKEHIAAIKTCIDARLS